MGPRPTSLRIFSPRAEKRLVVGTNLPFRYFQSIENFSLNDALIDSVLWMQVIYVDILLLYIGNSWYNIFICVSDVILQL